MRLWLQAKSWQHSCHFFFFRTKKPVKCGFTDRLKCKVMFCCIVCYSANSLLLSQSVRSVNRFGHSVSQWDIQSGSDQAVVIQLLVGQSVSWSMIFTIVDRSFYLLVCQNSLIRSVWRTTPVHALVLIITQRAVQASISPPPHLLFLLTVPNPIGTNFSLSLAFYYCKNHRWQI